MRQINGVGRDVHGHPGVKGGLDVLLRRLL